MRAVIMPASLQAPCQPGSRRSTVRKWTGGLQSGCMSAPYDLAVVVDDDPDIALAARLSLRALFARIETLNGPDELLRLLSRERPDVILLELNCERGATDGSEGLDYLGRIRAIDPDAAVVIITAHSAVSVAVEAVVEAGFAPDYLEARHAETLERVARRADGPIRLLAAARLGATRLIDNVAV